MAIRLDNDHICSVVIQCDDHPFYSSLALSMAEGHLRAYAHEKAFHPDERNAFDALKRYRGRHPEEFDLLG
jgi:hypothetical protein